MYTRACTNAHTKAHAHTCTHMHALAWHGHAHKRMHMRTLASLQARMHTHARTHAKVLQDTVTQNCNETKSSGL